MQRLYANVQINLANTPWMGLIDFLFLHVHLREALRFTMKQKKLKDWEERGKGRRKPSWETLENNKEPPAGWPKPYPACGLWPRVWDETLGLAAEPCWTMWDREPSNWWRGGKGRAAGSPVAWTLVSPTALGKCRDQSQQLAVNVLTAVLQSGHPGRRCMGREVGKTGKHRA